MMSATTRLRGGHRDRAGFTLVELMVVVAIIGVIIALTTAAAMQVVSYQRSSTTDGTIETVYSELQRQWTAVIALADKDIIPPVVISMAGGNERRARVIWKKLRLKEAFPMNFTEALTPWSLGGSNPTIESKMQQVLPGRPAYKSAISGISQNFNPADQSAYCLVLALRQGYGGNTFSEESLGTNALATDAVGMKKFVDGWSNPLALYRWPTANDELDNSSPLGPYNSSNPKTWFRDPLDPEGLLQSQEWNFRGGQGVSLFEQYCHKVHSSDLRNPWVPRSNYMIPVIASAGRDGQWGLQRPTVPTAPDPMTIDLTHHADDNVYSFRLRLGGRGGQ
jgi:prepilin-type N-terminal cleavage/methylation domain-containing protein